MSLIRFATAATTEQAAGARRRRSAWILLAAILFATAPAAGSPWEPRDYSYLFMQGKVSLLRSGEPLTGVTIEASSKGRNYSAETDARGVFVFEKLPVGTYRLKLATPSGQVMQKVRPMQSGQRIRLQVRTDHGAPQEIILSPQGTQLVADLPQVPARWKKFWIQLGILFGILVVFAL